MMEATLRMTVARLLDNQRITGPGPINSPRGVTKNVQYTLDADGASSATIQLQGTNIVNAASADWVDLGSATALSTTGAGHSMSGTLNTDAWGFVRCNVTALTGTNARVNGYMVAI